MGFKIIDATLNVPYRKRAVPNRLDVRLDSEHRRRLEELAQENGVPISEVVRRLIDGAYEDIVRARRRQAIERLIGLNVEDPPDPDTLSRELEAAHEPRRSSLTPMFPSMPPVATIPIRNHAPGFSAILADDPQSLVTDSEVLQEIMHRYLASGRWILGREVVWALAEAMHGRIEPVNGEDVIQAAELADRHPGVSARDLVHAAVMQRLGTYRIISADTGL